MSPAWPDGWMLSTCNAETRGVITVPTNVFRPLSQPVASLCPRVGKIPSLVE